MEAGDTPTPPGGDERLSGEEVRRATFPQALRGYDREAVHDMLERVADWMEGKAQTVSSATPGMREEIAKVGERTAGILTAAEEAARNLRDEAVEYADRLRTDTEDEARKARLNASQRMDELVAEAEAKAQGIIDDAIARRRQLNLAISSLIDRRDEIAADATRLAEELLGAVEDLRSSDRGDEPADAEPESAEDEIFEPEPSEEEVLEPESGEEEIIDHGSEKPTLLVDPDAEDETPPQGFSR